MQRSQGLLFGQEFLQAQAAGTDGQGVFHPHIPPVPWLGVAQDKAVLGGVGREPLVGAGIGKAGVLGGVVRAEDVGRIAGAVLVGVGFGQDGGGPGRCFLFRLVPGKVGLFLRLIGCGAGVRVMPSACAASAMLRYCCAASASSWVPASSAASSVGEGSSSKGRLAFTSTRRASSASKR